MKKILLLLALTASVITHAQEAVITANAGDHASACGNSFYNLLYQNATASGGTVSWSSSGDGWFQYLTGSGPYTDLSPLYHLGPADRTNGSAIITLTVTGDDNSVTTSSFTLTLVPPPTAIIDPIIVNPWDELLCTSSSYSFSNAVVADGANIYWHSSGDGSFNNDGIQKPIYTPGPQDIVNGYVNIRLNVYSYGEIFCDNRVEVRLVIAPRAGADASVCGNSFYNLLYQNATASDGTVSWSSSGDGWFQYLTGSGPYTDLSPLYHLGPADRTNGSAIITLTVTGVNNRVTTDSFTLTLVPPPTAIIDPIIVNPWDELHVCTGGSYSFSNAVVAEGANIYWHSSGDGSFNNDGIQNPIYTPGPQDIANGYVNIRLNVYSYGEIFCDNRVEVRLVIDPYPTITASAGTNGSISSPGITSMSCDGIEDKTYTITPDADYLISDVTVDGTSATALTTGSYATGGTYEFIDVQGDHTISVTFALACTNVGLADAMATSASICADATTTLTYSGLTGTNASVTWTQFEDGTGMTYGTGITSNQVGPGTYYAYATGDCGSPVYRAVTVATTPKATPTFTQVEPVCSGATMETLVTLSNNGIEGAWSPALNNLETTEYTFTPTEGQCANTATMTITVMPNVLYYADTDGDGFGNPSVTQQSCSGAPIGYVTNNTDCDDTDAGIYPNSTKTIPIGLLSGANVICNGTTVTYTIDPVANATSYQWTLPTGATGTSTSTSIAVNFGSAYTVGDLCVQAVNGACLSATTCLTITPLTAVPPTPGAITGPVTVLAPSTTKTYTIASVANTTSYIWTAPANATLVSGQGTTSATFDFGAVFTTGLIAVKANNCKGNSATRSLTVKKVGLSAVRAAQCGATLTAINATIYANTIIGATKYRFEVSNGSTVQTYETTNYYFNLTQLEIMPSFSTAYSIKVAILFDTVWQEYGAPCLVTTPAAPLTKVQDTQCGKVLTSLNAAIVANTISGATNYRFKIVNGASTQTIETASRWFYLKSLTGGGSFGTTYTISVAYKQNEGWSDYGTECAVTTPMPSLVTKVQDSQCGQTLATLKTAVVANLVPLATNYRFKIVNGATTRYAETVSRWFYLKSLTGGALYSTTYTISVAAKFNGVWGAYGEECTVTTPSAPLTRPVDLETETDLAAFNVMGYPNPYTNTFQLDINTQSSALVNVMVYDMVGKLIEVRNSGISELGTMEMGDNYATGIYNVMVTQGTEVKTVRMIKK